MSAFGDDSARLGAIRWRVPPRSVMDSYGNFTPIPIRVPLPAPPPPGFPQPPLSPLPLPLVPVDDKPAGYGPPCPTIWETPGDGTPLVLECNWALYTPIMRPWPALAQYNHSLKGFIEPTLVSGMRATKQILLVQSGAEISISTNSGAAFTRLCKYPDAAARPSSSGFANGLGLLADGTLLAAHYYSTAGTTRTVVYRGKLPSATSAEADCGWSSGFTLPPLGSAKNSVGGGLGIRFTEDVSSGAVLFAVRNEDEYTAQGRSIPKAARTSYSVIYRSLDFGRTFSAHGRLSDNTAEADLLVLPPTADGEQVVLATSRYQTSHFSSARFDTGVLMNATKVSYKATAVFRSTSGGASWSAPGLVTGRGQQVPSCHKDTSLTRRRISLLLYCAVF